MKTLLKEILIEKPAESGYPFSIPLFKNGLSLKLEAPITFIVGHNGSGKSTFLENLADAVGFNTVGGGRNFANDNDSADDFSLADSIKLSWSIKKNKGFFFRAETFWDFAKNLDELDNDSSGFKYDAYGSKSLQEQSHGESFMSLFTNRFFSGLFILDEPESALSPEKQIELVALLSELTKVGERQFIIATHSPILIATPNSIVYEIENGKLIQKPYYDTSQFKLYKTFLNAPDAFLHHFI